MSNVESYNSAFKDAFDVSDDMLGADLVYQSIENWDSVGHMQLIAALEDTFDIMMEMDDIIDFSSYEVGKEILAKYDVVI